MRYSSKLTALLPANTAVFVSMPNLASTLKEANAIFEERAKQSPVLNQWWNADGAKRVRAILEQVRTRQRSSGRKIVIAVPASAGKLELRLWSPRKEAGVKQLFSGSPLNVEERGGFVSIGNTGAGFESSEFGKRILQSYSTGAGWLFAADMEQFCPLP